MNVSGMHKFNCDFNYFLSVLCVLCLVCVSLPLSYSLTYPDVNLDTVGYEYSSAQDINITGEACYACVVSVYINEELKDEKYIEPPLTIINWGQVSGDLEMVAGERFQINYTPLAGDQSTVYSLEVFGEDKGEFSVFELSPEYVFDDMDYISQTIVVSSTDYVLGGGSKRVYFKEELVGFYFDEFTNADFISGQNTITVEVSGDGFSGADSPIEENFNINLEKYTIQFELSDDTEYVANEAGAQISGVVEELDDFSSVGFAYLVNGPGEIITNTGLMRDFEVDETDYSFNFSIPASSFREGINSLDLIGYTAGNRGNFVAFKRINITRDSEPPTIVIESAKLYDGSTLFTTLEGSQVQDVLFTGYATISLNISVDAEVLTWEYDSTPKEELVINNSVIVDFKAKDASTLVKDIVDMILDGKTTSEIVEELEVDEQTISAVNGELNKAQDEGIAISSKWYEEVAQELGVGYFLILRAEDVAKNSATKSLKVLFNDEDPELIVDEMRPKSIFEDEEVFSNTAYIAGRTNQPYVDLSFIVIGPDDYVQTDDGDTQKLKCDDAYDYYSNGLWRNNEGFYQYTEEEDVIVSSFEVQLGDILDVTGNSLDYTSDSEGYFGSEGLIDAILQGETVVFRTSSQEDDSSYDNTICAMLTNEYGRTTLEEFDVSYEAGNYDWDINGITFNQNSINPYEIESSIGEVGGFRTGVVIEMDYVGQLGESDDLDFNQVRVKKRGSEPRNIKVIESEVVYYYQYGTLNLYIPLEFSKRGLQVQEYPDSEVITLEITPRAVVEGYEVDNVNSEFVDIEVTYDKDLAADWLTPNMVDKGINFLNKTKEWTGNLRDTTRDLIPVGALSCVGAKVWYSLQAASLDPENPADKEQLDKLEEQMYYVCDRTYCSAAPHKADTRSRVGELGFLSMNVDSEGNGELEEIGDLADYDTIEQGPENRILSQYSQLDVGGECRTPDGKQGRYVRAEVNEFEQDTSSSFFISTTGSSTKILPRKCVAYTYEDTVEESIEGCYNTTKYQTASDRRECRDEIYSNPQNIVGLDVQSVHHSYYNEDSPYFDNTRCLGNAGFDPKDTIYDSVMCACIPETYQHLNKLYKIQENIQECLEDVKTGEIEGTYCERLISVSTCDLLTGAIFRLTQQQQIIRDERVDPNSQQGLFSALAQSDSLLNDRYEGSSFYSSGRGFNTKSIANSVCLFAINGDFSAFETALIGDIENDIEVAPSYTRTIPQTRFESFNPITGEMTIQYKFTHNGISGGSPVTFTYELVCDSSKEQGEYCPEGVTYAQDANSKLKKRTITIPSNGQAQELIEYRDIGALYVYNVLKVGVEYKIGNEVFVREHEEIIQRGPEDVLGSGAWNSCSFDEGFGVGELGGGIVCSSSFSDVSDLTYYLIDEDKTFVVVDDSGTSTVSAGQFVGVNIFYTARGEEIDQKDRGKLWFKSDECEMFGYVDLDERHIDGTAGNFFVELPVIPSGVEPKKGKKDQVVTGSCDLWLRMTGNDIEITEDEFEADILEQLDIQAEEGSDVYDKVNDYVKLSFKLTTEDKKEMFNIIYPQEDYTLCVDENGVLQQGIQLAGTGGFTSQKEEYSVEIELSRYAQDPIEYESFQCAQGFNTLLISEDSSGQFSSIDFLESQKAEFIVKKNGAEVERFDIELRECESVSRVQGGNACSVYEPLVYSEDESSSSGGLSGEVYNSKDEGFNYNSYIKLKEFAEDNSNDIEVRRMMAFARAIAQIETGFQPFEEGEIDVPKIRFECHLFNEGKEDLNLNERARCQTGDKGFSTVTSQTNYEAFQDALEMDEEKAYSSSSYGLFQSLGRDHKDLIDAGTYEEVYQKAQTQEGQVELFLKFIENKNTILTELQKDEEMDFREIATVYNGANSHLNDYENILETNYEKYYKEYNDKGIHITEIPKATDFSSSITDSTDNVIFENQDAIRSKGLNPLLVDILQETAQAQGFTVHVFSGGQEDSGDKRVGSTRHDFGNAADFYITDNNNNNKIAIDSDKFNAFVTEAFKNGIQGGGASKGYMGEYNMHLDIVGNRCLGCGTYWKSTPKFVDALRTGIDERKRDYSVNDLRIEISEQEVADENEKTNALLFYGTNDYLKESLVETSTKEFIGTLRDKGYTVVLVPPNPDLKVKEVSYPNVYTKSVEAGELWENGVTVITEKDLEYDQSDSLHITYDYARKLRDTYGDYSIFVGDSNAVRAEGVSDANSIYGEEKAKATEVGDIIDTIPDIS